YPIHLPPLRDRIDDVPLLAEHFLRRFGVANPAAILPADTGAFLKSRAWAGDVRALRAALGHAASEARGGAGRPDARPGQCEPAAPPARTPAPPPPDPLTVNTATEIAVSPDGKHVAFCLATWKEATDDRKTDLWVVATDGTGKPKQLTSDRANDRHPKWSADGKSIYVLANRKKDGQKEPPFNGQAQVWKVDIEDGEVSPITGRKGAGVSGFD